MTVSANFAIRFTRARAVQAQQSEKGTMLLDVESGVCWELNATGGFVWGLIEQELSVKDVVERLAKEFALSPTVVATDVCALLEQLKNAKLITEIP